MPQASEYNREKNFLNENPDRTDHSALNAEFDQVSTSVNELRDNAALIQNDDGSLRTGVVTVDSLSQEVLNLMTGTDIVTVEGPQGETGPSFDANYRGIFAERIDFDNSSKGFAFLSMDTGLLYFKLSDASGDWSSGYQFGKGDTGDAGPTGDNGINGINGSDGLITSVEAVTQSVSLIGKTTLNITASVTAGKLSINVSAV